MRILSPVRLFALALSLLLIAGACSSSSSSDVASGGTDGDAASGGTRAANAEDQEGWADLEFESPLADFLGQDYGGFQMDEAAMIEQEREAGRVTAECMAELGFEYTPPDPSETMSFGMPDDLPPGSQAWVEKYGFGISTQMFPQSMVGDLVGMPDEGFMGPGGDFVDPNQEYVESLSEGERDAYFEALHGAPPDFPPGGPDADPEEMEAAMADWEPSGCQHLAYMDGPHGPDSNVERFYQTFGDEMQTLWQRVEADPRVIDFTNEVGDCVAEKGMTWTGMENVWETFGPRIEELQDAAYSSDPFAEAGLDPEEMTERELEEFYLEASRLDSGQLAVLAEIQAEEIAMALAVSECSGGPLEEAKLMMSVRAEYEQKFLDENADALAEFAPDN